MTLPANVLFALATPFILEERGRHLLAVRTVIQAVANLMFWTLCSTFPFAQETHRVIDPAHH